MAVNETMMRMAEPLLTPLSETITGFMSVIQVLLGGVFGLYFVMFLYRIYRARKLDNQMRLIFSKLNHIEDFLSEIDEKKVDKKKKNKSSSDKGSRKHARSTSEKISSMNKKLAEVKAGMRSKKKSLQREKQNQ